MEHLIDKSALVAEIERRFLEDYNTDDVEMDEVAQGVLASLKFFIDTLEVKEVNVWHDASETPKGAGDEEILVQFYDFHTSVVEIDDWEYLDHQTKWAYLKDLL